MNFKKLLQEAHPNIAWQYTAAAIVGACLVALGVGLFAYLCGAHGYKADEASPVLLISFVSMWLMVPMMLSLVLNEAGYELNGLIDDLTSLGRDVLRKAGLGQNVFRGTSPREGVIFGRQGTIGKAPRYLRRETMEEVNRSVAMPKLPFRLDWVRVGLVLTIGTTFSLTIWLVFACTPAALLPMLAMALAIRTTRRNHQAKLIRRKLRQAQRREAWVAKLAGSMPAVVYYHVPVGRHVALWEIIAPHITACWQQRYDEATKRIYSFR